MKLDTKQWNQLLADSLTVPGTDDPQPMMPDGPFLWSEWATAEWSAEMAFQRLGVSLQPWPDRCPRHLIQGVSMPEGIALNPMARNKVRTVAHELAHTLFGHSAPLEPDDDDDDVSAFVGNMVHGYINRLKMPVHEFEADATALLVCYALGQDESELSISRNYLQEFTKHALPIELPTDWKAVKTTAQRILSAGASMGHRVTARCAARKVHIGGAVDFVGKVKWSKR